MICVITKATLPEPIPRATAYARFSKTAERYLDIPGLVRKYFAVAGDGSYAVGVYLWQTRSAAEAFYTEEWHARQLSIFGQPLEMTWLECPVIAESARSEVVAVP